MVKLEWHTEKRIVRDITPLNFNPRKITKSNAEALSRSLTKFNLAEIPCINTDNSIISGKQRVEQLIVLGRAGEEIDVRVPNRKLSPTELKEYMLIANTHAGVFDAEIMDVHFANTKIEFELNVEETKEYGSKNKEIDTSKFKEETQMKMTFSNENFLRVKEQLNRLHITPEQIILKFLFDEQ